jgi:hypothetical protein
VEGLLLVQVAIAIDNQEDPNDLDFFNISDPTD